MKTQTLLTILALGVAGCSEAESNDAAAGARFEIIRGAAHMTFLDPPEDNVRIVRDFLNNLDVASWRPPQETEGE